MTAPTRDLVAEYWPIDRISTRPSGFYLPSADGIEATIVPVEDASGEVIDLVAYDPHVPNRWWLRTGHGRVLGEYQLDLAHDYRLPVVLVDTPHEWLRHRSPMSICVLQPARARAILNGVEVTREGVRRAA